jgi:hypothetical protein
MRLPPCWFTPRSDRSRQHSRRSGAQNHPSEADVHSAYTACVDQWTLRPELAAGQTRTLIISLDRASIAEESLAAAKLYSLASRRFSNACISSKKAARLALFAFDSCMFASTRATAFRSVNAERMNKELCPLVTHRVFHTRQIRENLTHWRSCTVSNGKICG